MKNAFKLFILALFATSLTFVGCGDKEDAADTDTEEATTEESSSTEASSGGDYTARFKSGMIDLSKSMIDVAEGIESVEDAEAAEPKIESAMNGLAALFTELGDQFDEMTMADMKDLQGLQNIESDPEVKEWMDKAESAMDKLKTDHPEAADKLQELGQKHSEKFMGAMMGVMMKIGQSMGENGISGEETEVEDETAGE